MTSKTSFWLALALGLTLGGMTHATDQARPVTPASNDPNL